MEYDYFGRGTIGGNNSIGIEPATSTFYIFQYNTQSQQVLGVAKLLTPISVPSVSTHTFYPYASVGLGGAFNHACNAFDTLLKACHGPLILSPPADENGLLMIQDDLNQEAPLNRSIIPPRLLCDILKVLFPNNHY